MYTKEGELKISLAEKGHMMTLITFFDKWNPSSSTPLEEMCELQRGLYKKKNLIWSHAMRLS